MALRFCYVVAAAVSVPSGTERRPIVEFAIDSVKALKARESRVGKAELGKKETNKAARNKEARVRRQIVVDKCNDNDKGNDNHKSNDDKGNKDKNNNNHKGNNHKCNNKKGNKQIPNGNTDKASRIKTPKKEPPKQAVRPSTPEPALEVTRRSSKRQRAAEDNPATRKKRPFAKKGADREDALDDMVARYKAAMFGVESAPRKSKTRWFDA